MSDGGSLPGWYPDPGRADLLRWWDGRTWTGFTMASPSAGPHASYGSPAPYGSPTLTSPRADLDEELRARPWAYAGIAVWAVLAVGLAAISVSIGHDFRLLFDWIRTVADNRDVPGYVAPQPPHTTPLGYLGILLAVPQIAFAIWLHRSALTARALGYPQRLNPALGAFSIFIPVVNLWMPAQCMMGCLPVGHPVRARVPWLWALYVVSGVLVTGVAVAGAFSETAGYLGVIPVALVYVVLLVAARSFIRAADEDHRRALAPASVS